MNTTPRGWPSSALALQGNAAARGLDGDEARPGFAPNFLCSRGCSDANGFGSRGVEHARPRFNRAVLPVLELDRR